MGNWAVHFSLHGILTHGHEHFWPMFHFSCTFRTGLIVDQQYFGGIAFSQNTLDKRDICMVRIYFTRQVVVNVYFKRFP